MRINPEFTKYFYESVLDLFDCLSKLKKYSNFFHKMSFFYAKLTCMVTNDTDSDTMDINIKFRDWEQFEEFEGMSFDVIQHLISGYIATMREGFYLDERLKVIEFQTKVKFT